MITKPLLFSRLEMEKNFQDMETLEKIYIIIIWLLMEIQLLLKDMNTYMINVKKLKIQKIIKLMLQSFQNIEFMSHVKLELEDLEDLFYIKIEMTGMNSISIILMQKLLEILFLQNLKNH